MWRVVKQLYPSPTSSVDRHGETFTDPWWASRNTYVACLLYTSPSPRDKRQSRMPSSA